MTMTMTKTLSKTFSEHPQRTILETCDLWDIWPDWWGDMTWPKQTMTMTMAMTMAMTFKEHPQRAILETCDLWDTDITFLTIENNNLKIQRYPWIKSVRDSIRNSCDVFHPGRVLQGWLHSQHHHLHLSWHLHHHHHQLSLNHLLQWWVWFFMLSAFNFGDRILIWYTIYKCIWIYMINDHWSLTYFCSSENQDLVWLESCSSNLSSRRSYPHLLHLRQRLLGRRWNASSLACTKKNKSWNFA